MNRRAIRCRSKEGKRNSIIRQNIASPFDYRTMTVSEAQRVVVKTLEVLKQSNTNHSKKQAVAILVLSLITGLSIEALVAIEVASDKNCDCTGLFWRPQQGGWFLINQPSIPHRDLSRPSKVAASPNVLVCKKTESAIYPVPHELGAFLPLRMSRFEEGTLEEQANEVLKKISKAMTKPLSLKMVRTFAENHMLMECPCFADYLMLPGKTKKVETGLYYLQSRRSKILISFTKFLEKVGLSVPEINIVDTFVGSALIPQKKEISSVFCQMHSHLGNVDLQSIDGFRKFHNWLATYAGSMLRLASGSRGEQQTSISMSSLNLQDNLWHLYEKGTLRKIPLPTVVTAQLKYYIGYLQHIKNISQHQDRSLFKELCQILESDSERPLIFANSSSQSFVNIYQTDLLDHMSLGLKKNNLRHFVYSHVIQSLAEESLRQYIGHTSFYNDSQALDSGQNYQQLSTIRTVLDDIFRDLGISAFDPIASHLVQKYRSA